VNTLFFGLVNNYKSLAEEKKLAITSDCTAFTGAIKADERLLEESLGHIIDNAFKFTKEGTVNFCIEKNKEGIDILVQDTGIGISKEFMNDLFKPFYQEDMRIARGFEGNGLGLAIANKCCEVNGFEIKIESEKNKGTNVVVHIPEDKIFNENLI
jgi:signal transduction histidine kinase